MTVAMTEVRSAVVCGSDVRSQVLSLFATLYPQGGLVERRGEQRCPFPYLVSLTPVDEDDEPIDAEPVVVAGKHLSERGLSFYHIKPLPHRRMIATLGTGKGGEQAFIIDLNWCRFTQKGWYESGGRFIQSVPVPLSLVK